MRAIVRRFDAFLSRRLRVFEFCDDKVCILRLRLTKVPRNLQFPEREVKAGAPELELHLWNQRVPPIPPSGANVTWGLRTSRLLIHSYRAVAEWMKHYPNLADLQVVGGVTILISQDGSHPGGVYLMQRLGFMVLPYYRPFGAFGEFWENFYSWVLIWTYNPASMHSHHFLTSRRAEIWMLADEFMKRYG